MKRSAPPQLMRVLVTDAQVSTAVSVVRSLGRAGHEPIVACPDRAFPLAASSRHCRGLVRVPDPLLDPDACTERILSEVSRGDYDALLPLADATTTALAPRRSVIEAYCAYCAAPPQAIERAADKWVILEEGRRAGLRVPEVWRVDSESDWTEVRAAAPTPLVFRARCSIVRAGDRLRKPPASVHFDRNDADREAAARLERGEPFLVSHYFPGRGRGRGIYLFLVSGLPALWYGHLRLRETDPRGSSACAAMVMEPSEEEVTACAAFLARLGVEGTAMVEFRRDAASNEDRLIEVNARLWGSVSLAMRAGLDFPRHQVEYFALGQVPRMPAVRLPAMASRHLTAELSHLLHAWKGPPPGWRAAYPTFPAAWRDFVRGFREGRGYYNQGLEDPLPGLAEPLAYIVGRLQDGGP